MARPRAALALLALAGLMGATSAFTPPSALSLRAPGPFSSPRSRPTPPQTVCQFQMPKFSMPSFGVLGGQPKDGDAQAPVFAAPRLQGLKAKLLAACDEGQRGVKGTGGMPKEEFEALVEEIAALNPTDGPAVSPLMGGSWELAWTTEKEVLFLIEKGLFWDQCTKVYQEIDVAAPSLSNNVEFENEGCLKVQSSFMPGQVDGDTARFDFKFNTLAVKWRDIKLSLPPVGAGWSKQIFLDKTLRMQRDSRGDLAIYCKR